HRRRIRHADENEPLPDTAMDRRQSVLGLVEAVVEPLLLGHADQSSVSAIGPVVEAAGEDRFVAVAKRFMTRLGYDRVAAMRAHIVERPDDIILASDQDDGRVRRMDALDLIVSGFRNFLDTADAQPDLLEDLLLLGGMEGG